MDGGRVSSSLVFPVSTKKHQRDIIAAIEKEGAKVVGVIRGFKHIRLLCEYSGKKWQQTISVSSSSHRDILNHRAIARRAVREGT